MEKRSDTIAAISTAMGKSSIGIIRVSGRESFQIVSKLILSKTPENYLIQLKSRKMIHAFLLDEERNPVDEILVCFMPSNKSFTGEETVEINCHGGIASVKYALERVMDAGARLAGPGEFTRRAWENGKIDLTQAEAINQIINSYSLKSLKIAWHQYEGAVSKQCDSLKNIIKEMVSYTQYFIDVEDAGMAFDSAFIKHKLSETKNIMNDMLVYSERNKNISEGIWVTIYGPPNVGKSSIFNRLLRMQRSIVCEIPGTTRDHISEDLEINGFRVRITDTAGIRKTNDKIEIESIKRSYEQIKSSDISIYVIDISKEISSDDISEILLKIKNREIIVFNKNDSSPSESCREIIESHKSNENILTVSALTGQNIGKLEKRIENRLEEDFSNNENLFMMNARQNAILIDSLKKIEELLEKNIDHLDIMVYEFKKLLEKLDIIIGNISNDEILSEIFNKFCIGK